MHILIRCEGHAKSAYGCAQILLKYMLDEWCTEHVNFFSIVSNLVIERSKFSKFNKKFARKSKTFL